jgi:hypothetical protein
VKEIVHIWDRHRHARGLEGVAIVTDTDNATVDVLNALCQAKRQAAGELTNPAITVTDRVTGRCERVHAGDRVRFIRLYLDRAIDGRYVANGTGGQVLAVDVAHGEVVVGCDDGRPITLQPAALEEAQPLRLGYASHALKLQGGQAQVVLVLPGSWQTSRQSAYSMATRSVEELHVFVDAETQQTGPYRHTDPVLALGERWKRDARKLAATLQCDHQRLDGPAGRSTIDEDLAVACPWSNDIAMVSRAPELPGGRGAPDELGIEP